MTHGDLYKIVKHVDVQLRSVHIEKKTLTFRSNNARYNTFIDLIINKPLLSINGRFMLFYCPAFMVSLLNPKLSDLPSAPVRRSFFFYLSLKIMIE